MPGPACATLREGAMSDTEDVGAFLGPGVGKSTHHAARAPITATGPSWPG
jgi:hypothetical protein